MQKKKLLSTNICFLPLAQKMKFSLSDFHVTKLWPMAIWYSAAE